MRIVIDGTLGSGKTSLLTGESPSGQSDGGGTLRDMGYPVFGELIRGTVDARAAIAGDPFGDWDAFFELAIDRAEEQFRSGEQHPLCFYDRGLPFLGVMAKRYGHVMPKRYLDSLHAHRYDSPVLIFEPVMNADYTAPRPGEIRASTFTLAERMEQHKDTVAAYRSLDYDVVLVPLFDSDEHESNRRRLEFICELLGI